MRVQCRSDIPIIVGQLTRKQLLFSFILFHYIYVAIFILFYTDVRLELVSVRLDYEGVHGTLLMAMEKGFWGNSKKLKMFDNVQKHPPEVK